MPDKIAVIGSGSWGTALALLIARNGYSVSLWGHEPNIMEKMKKANENSYFLPGIKFPSNLSVEVDLNETLDQAQHLLVVVPSHAFSQVVQNLRGKIDHIDCISWATKGFDPASGELLHLVAKNYLPDKSTVVVSGPTFAMEVAKGLPTALTVASVNHDSRKQWQKILHGDKTRAYTSKDIVGVQVGGAVKNVMAISAGISDGLGYGANARAALITRGLAEITRLGIHLGGRQETFMGLTGMGDLALTCTDNQSRNRRMGLALARGLTIEQAKIDIGQEIEGINTTKEVFLKARELDVEMPITEQVYQVLYQDLSAQEAVVNLFNRKPKYE